MDATKKKLAAGAVAVAALAGGGAALAAGGIVGSDEDQQAIIDDAAKRLGVEPDALENALEGALGARLDEAVAAGKLTKEQASELKARLKDGTFPLFGGHRPGHHGFGFRGPELFDASASFLGVTEAELRTQLEAGKSLADVAAAEGKSVAGLKAVLVKAVEKELGEAVDAGRLTEAQRDEALDRFGERLDDFVARKGIGPRGRGDNRPAGFDHAAGGMPM